MGMEVILRILFLSLGMVAAFVLAGCAAGPANPIYRGAVQDGVPHGKGFKIWPDGTRFDGEWQFGNMSHGVLTWRNGDRYEGEFQGNQLHGRGVRTWANGTYYEGAFANGQPEGEGAAVALYYEGEIEGCLGECPRASSQYTVVAGTFSSSPELKLVARSPCGSDPVECRKKFPEVIAAAALERKRLQAEAERQRAIELAEQARLAAEAEKERARIEAAKRAEQARIAEAKRKKLQEGTAAEVYMYADSLESDKDYIQASEAYRTVVTRFPESHFAASAMTRLGAMRDKRDQQEAEEKRLAAEERRLAIEAENRRKEEQLRRDELAVRQTEAEARKAAAQQAQQPEGSGIGDKIQDELIKQGTKRLLDELF